MPVEHRFLDPDTIHDGGRSWIAHRGRTMGEPPVRTTQKTWEHAGAMLNDARGSLVSDPFDHRRTKDGRVLISRGGRQVTTVAGAAAARLAKAIDEASDDAAIQQLLARATGNYRRGTEHPGRG
jgi:hypothetical protein